MTFAALLGLVFDGFLQDRFGFAVLNGGAALDPLGAGIEIAGVTGSVIGDGIAGRLGPSLFGGRDTISLVGPAAPTFRVTSPPPLGSDILGDRTSYEPSITAPGHVDPGRPGRSTFETFSTADLPAPGGVTARSRILDYLEDDVKASASAGYGAAGAQPAGGHDGGPPEVRRGEGLEGGAPRTPRVDVARRGDGGLVARTVPQDVASEGRR